MHFVDLGANCNSEHGTTEGECLHVGGSRSDNPAVIQSVGFRPESGLLRRKSDKTGLRGIRARRILDVQALRRIAKFKQIKAVGIGGRVEKGKKKLYGIVHYTFGWRTALRYDI